MPKKKTSAIKQIEAVRNLVDAYRRIYRPKGIDPDKILADFAAFVAQRLASPGARTDFEELCKSGCVPPVLAAIVVSLRAFPHLERFWIEIVCRPERRQRATRALEKAGAIIEEVFEDFIGIEDEIPKDAWNSLGHLLPSGLVSELRFYVSLLNIGEGMEAGTKPRSIREVSKYLLASYVKRTTGRFHDGNVSGLLAEVIGPADYNEVAQRMWRSRNYARLEKQFSKFTDFAVATSVVIGNRT